MNTNSTPSDIAISKAKELLQNSCSLLHETIEKLNTAVSCEGSTDLTDEYYFYLLDSKVKITEAMTIIQKIQKQL